MKNSPRGGEFGANVVPAPAPPTRSGARTTWDFSRQNVSALNPFGHGSIYLLFAAGKTQNRSATGRWTTFARLERRKPLKTVNCRQGGSAGVARRAAFGATHVKA